MPTRATGVARMDGAMRGERRTREAGLLNEFAQKRFQAFHLPRGGPFLLEVADQANPDAGHVELLARQMSALDLFFPPVADGNLAVAHAASVPDEKMIRHAIFHVALLAMETIDPARCGGSRGGVMNHNVLPGAAYRNGAELFVGFGSERRSRPCDRRLGLGGFSCRVHRACGKNPGHYECCYKRFHHSSPRECIKVRSQES